MRLFALVTVFAALFVVGCTSQDANKMGEDAKGIAQNAGKSISGATLAEKVSAALNMRKDVDTKDIHIEAKDGVVTITGHVKSAEMKGHVFDVASNTTGVEKVDNTGLIVDK